LSTDAILLLNAVPLKLTKAFNSFYSFSTTVFGLVSFKKRTLKQAGGSGTITAEGLEALEWNDTGTKRKGGRQDGKKD
jgi:hypothetical protein